MSDILENDFLQFFHKNYKKKQYDDQRNFKRCFKSVENLAKKIIKTDINKGLDLSNNNDILWRKKMFGENIHISNSNSTFLNFFLISIDDLMIKVIFLLSIMIIIIDFFLKGDNKEYIESILVIISLLIYLLLISWNDYSLYKKALKLEEKRSIKICKVIRNNKLEIILNKEILVGDILVLKKGDIVEADGFAINENKIGVDESALFQNYNIQYKSSKFDYNRNSNEYICPFIFAGSYIIEGEGYLMVAAVGKNIYKNSKIYYEMLNDNEGDNENKLNNDIDEYEYFNEIGYFKMNISLFSEKIASFGMFLFIIFGFALIIKKGILFIIGKKSIISIGYLYEIIKDLIFILIVSLLAVPNNLNMIDFISFLSDEKIMKKKNINIKHKKYPELAYIDTLIILDNNNLLKDNNKEDIFKIIKKIIKCGINVILVTDKDFQNALVLGKELGIIKNEEFNNAKKIVNKYVNLNKNNSLCIESNFFDVLYGNVKFEEKHNGKEKVMFLDLDYFKKNISNLKILSKAQKKDKLILVNGLEQIGKKICLTGVSIEDINLLRMVNISFGKNNDADTLIEKYSLTLLNNSFSSFWKAYVYSCNLHYKIMQYMELFTINFVTSLIINIIGIIIYNNIPLNKFIIIYLKVLIDILVPYLISQENSCKVLLLKNINEIHGWLGTAFKICVRVIILYVVMIKGNSIFNISTSEKSEYNLWDDKDGMCANTLFFVFSFMMIVHLVIIIIKSHLNFIKSGFYLCFILILHFFIVIFGNEIFKIRLISQNNLIKCFEIALLIVPFDILFSKI